MSGPDVQEIYFMLADTGDNKAYNTALEKLNAYFTPKVNIQYERHLFRQLHQTQCETMDQFVTRLSW